ncbi:hypothetical protein [Rhizobium sp. SG2393]|uniref:hypothetical protein n=1 Tax=Rhizobium sp. SG2393 TaxID=3276279 RepID=UPI00366ECE91
MRDERPDPYLLIGLHKLAEMQGEGMLPELHDALLRLPQPGAERPSALILPFIRKEGARLRRRIADGGQVILFGASSARRS